MELTVAEKATVQIDIKNCSFTVSQILRGESRHVRFFNLKAKVTLVEDVQTVGSYPDKKSKRNVHLSDNTVHIDLVLWRDRADNAEFEEGDVLGLENMVLSEFNNHFSLTATLETIITKLNENMTISAAPPKPSPKSNVISMQTSILGLKEFSCTFK